MASRVLELLRSMKLFSDLGDDDLGNVVRMLKERKVAEDENVFVQGDPGDGLYVILHGRVRISTVDQAGRERVLAFYGPGEFFGDMAIVTGEPRSATASASTDVRLLQLRKDDFDLLVATNVGIMRGMMRVMGERQTAMNTRIGQDVGVELGDLQGHVTVVFSPSGGAGQTVVATNLAVALAQLAPERVVILDLDLLFGHVAMLLDLMPRAALASITPAAIRAFDRENLAHYLTHHPDSSLRVMAGTLRPEDSEVVSADHVRAVLELLRGQFVHVVIDAGSRFSEPCLTAIEIADQIIVLGTPEATAVHGSLESQRVLRELLSIPAQRLHFVQNQPTPYGSAACDSLAEALGTARVSAIPYGGQDVSQASLDGFPLVMSHPDNAAAQAIVALARQLERSAREQLALAAH